jgi:hypothetical protein
VGQPISSEREVKFLEGFFNTLYTNHLIINGNAPVKKFTAVKYKQLQRSGQAGFKNLPFNQAILEHPQRQTQLQRRSTLQRLHLIKYVDHLGNETAVPDSYDPLLPDTLATLILESESMERKAAAREQRPAMIHRELHGSASNTVQTLPESAVISDMNPISLHFSCNSSSELIIRF